MELRYNKGKVEVWETGRQNNAKIYTSGGGMEQCSRKDLTIIETKMEIAGYVEEAKEIKTYLGKILRTKNIPQVIPTGNYRITTRLSYLKESIERYKEEYGLDLNPDFQRGDVWSEEQRVAYVEFLLQGGKSNPIYFNHPGWMRDFQGGMVVVDGKQRLTSLLMFLKDKLPVFVELDKEGKGYYSSEFDYISCDIEIVINNLPTREKVLEWYLQMNKGNIAHKKAELDKVEELLIKERAKK